MLNVSLENLTDEAFFIMAIEQMQRGFKNFDPFNVFPASTHITFYTRSLDEHCKSMEEGVNFKKILEQVNRYIDSLAKLEIIEYRLLIRDLLYIVVECQKKSFDMLITNVFPDEKIAWRVNAPKSNQPSFTQRDFIFGTMQTLSCEIHYLIKSVMQTLIRHLFWYDIEELQSYLSANMSETLDNLKRFKDFFTSAYPSLDRCFIYMVELASARCQLPEKQVELFSAFLMEQYEEDALVQYCLPGTMSYLPHIFSNHLPLKNYYCYELGRIHLFNIQHAFKENSGEFDSYVLGLYHALNKEKPDVKKLTQSLNLSAHNFYILKSKLLSLMQLVMHRLLPETPIIKEFLPQYDFKGLMKHVDLYLPTEIGRSWINMMSLIQQYNKSEPTLNDQKEEEKSICHWLY
jgi:hypothetical protein